MPLSGAPSHGCRCSIRVWLQPFITWSSPRTCNTKSSSPAQRLESTSHLRVAAARHQAKTEMWLLSATLSMPLVATCNDGGGRPDVAAKSAWHRWSAFARSDVGWVCLCSASRERDPRGNSSRNRRSDGEGALHSPGWYGRGSRGGSFRSIVRRFRCPGCLNARSFRLKSGGL